ncbi:MAG: hypothetical protein ACR2OD_08625 [Gaiellaceae bacterium]
MPDYDIVITVDLEDDIEAARILDEVQKAIHPLPRPDKEWSFAIGCHTHAGPKRQEPEPSGAKHEPEMLAPGGDSLLPPGDA